jgi:surface antigen
MKFLRVLLILPIGLGAAACDKETAGTVIGAGAGAVVGSQFGKGAGRVAATVAGAAIGAYLGNRIGRYLDAQDRRRAQEAADRAMEDYETGREANWTNPDSGNSGTIAPTSGKYRDQRSGRECRDFTEKVTLKNGQTENITGKRCKKADGSWEFVG